MATKETVKLTNVLFGEKTFSAIEQTVGINVDSLDEVIDGNKNIDVVKSNDKLLVGINADNAPTGTVLTTLGDGTSAWTGMAAGIDFTDTDSGDIVIEEVTE